MTEVTHTRTSFSAVMRKENQVGIFRRAMYDSLITAKEEGTKWLQESGEDDKDNCHIVSVQITDEGNVVGSKIEDEITYKEVKEEDE
jgi:hypothetical protein